MIFSGEMSFSRIGFCRQRGLVFCLFLLLFFQFNLTAFAQDNLGSATSGSPDVGSGVAVYENSLLVGTGFIIGALGEGENSQVAVIVPKSAIQTRDMENLRVSLQGQWSQRQEVKKIVEVDFNQAYRGRETIAAAAGVSLTKANPIFLKAQYDDPVVVLFVSNVWRNADVPRLTIVDDSCRTGRGRRERLRVFFAGQNGMQTLDWDNEVGKPVQPTRQPLIGAFVSSDCSGVPNIRYFLSGSEGEGGYTKATIATVLEATKLFIKSRVPTIKFTFGYSTGGAVTSCPDLGGRSMVAEYVFENGDRLKVDEIPERSNELNYVPHKNESINRPAMEGGPPKLYKWGKNSQSKEVFLLWTGGQRFVFERYCKSNLRYRGKLEGAGKFTGSQDSGWEFDDGSFFLSFGDNSAIYSSNRLSVPVRILDIPQGLEQMSKVRIDGNEVLVGWSGRHKRVQFSTIPDNFDHLVSEAGGAGLRLKWRSWSFPQDLVASSEFVELKIDGAFVSLLTDKGIGIAQLVDSQTNMQLVKAFLAKDSRQDFGAASVKLLGSTVVRFSEGANFALVAIYSHKMADSQGTRERVLIAPVINEKIQRLFSIDNGNRFSMQAEDVKKRLYSSTQQREMFNLEISRVHLTLDTPSELMERYFGILIIEVKYIKSLDPGDRSLSQFENFKMYYPIHFWFNKFDRVWEDLHQSNDARPQNLCSGFSLWEINVITRQRRPKRVIVPHKKCGNQPLGGTGVKHIPIGDTWGALPVNLGR